MTARMLPALQGDDNGSRMWVLSTLRRGFAILLLGALFAPELAAAVVRERPRASGCLCARQACCTGKAGAACPLARRGGSCSAGRAAAAPSLRSSCGCRHEGGAGATQQRDETLTPALHAGIAPPPYRDRLPLVGGSAPRFHRLPPESPPPQPSQRLA